MAETSLSLILPNMKKNSHRIIQRSSSSSPSSSLGIFSRKSFSLYDKLPSQPLRLSVLKLDGSSFEIQVSKTATVEELKDAVEAVFSHMPQKGPGKISWPHVWGQFCLCYDGQKLVKEEDHLKNHGIKDGDQLRFIRHISNNWDGRIKRSKKRVVHLKQQRRCKTLRVNYCEPKENCDDDIGSDEEAIRNAEMKHHIEEHVVGKSKLIGFVGELFSYTPLAVLRKTRTTNMISPSMISKCLFGSFRKIRRIISVGKRRHYLTCREN